jgi:hypothetical protein
MSSADTAPRGRRAPAPGAARPVAPAGAPAAAPRATRMTLESIQPAADRPFRVMILGTEGIGKTELAAQMPNPVFLGKEDGAQFVKPKPQQFPKPLVWEDVFDAGRTLMRGQHDRETLVIDTVDSLEGLVYDLVKERENLTSKDMEAYGKWAKIAMEDWRRFINMLDALQEHKRMNICLLMHAGLGTVKNPSGADFQRFKPKLYGDAPGNLLKEWCDCVFFATHELSFQGDREVKKAFETGRRLIYTTYTAAHDAKNRWGLPDVIEFRKGTGWQDILALRGTADQQQEEGAQQE